MLIITAYYKSASEILPIAYKMFDDTVAKGAPGFDWTAAEKRQIETVSIESKTLEILKKDAPHLQYRHAMMILWVMSTCGVVLSMLIILPQFFDFNDKRGNPSHLVRCMVPMKEGYPFQCLVQIKLAWFLWFFVLIYVVVLGGGILYLLFLPFNDSFCRYSWIVSSPAVKSFDEHFLKCEKEEIFLTELEDMWQCTSDDDKEVADEHVRAFVV